MSLERIRLVSEDLSHFEPNLLSNYLPSGFFSLLKLTVFCQTDSNLIASCCCHMAVIASHPLHTEPSPRITTGVAIPSLNPTELMTSIMSYQYPPPPPPNGAEMDIPPPGYMSSYGVPQAPPSAMDMRPGQESSMSLKDRKDSLSQASLKIKRSMSTPNVRSQQNIPEHVPMGMPGEKRRNKLGYHRTSVACGE